MAKDDKPSVYVLEKLIESKWKFLDHIHAKGRKVAAQVARDRGCPDAGGTWRLRAQ